MSDSSEQLDAVLRELQSVKDRLAAVELESARARRRVRARWLVAVLALGASVSFAQLVSFAPNSPARADAVNGNFTYLRDWISAKVGAVGQPVTITGDAIVNGSATTGLRVNGPTYSDYPGASYDVWIQGGTASGGDARNLAMLGETGSDRLIINYAGEYAGGTRVDGSLTVTGRNVPNYDSGWVAVTGSANYTFTHGFNAHPSDVQLQTCGAVSGGVCTTRIVLSGGSGFNDGTSCINPVNMSTDLNTIYIANTSCNPWGYWVQGVGWTYTGGTVGQGFYRVLAWR